MRWRRCCPPAWSARRTERLPRCGRAELWNGVRWLAAAVPSRADCWSRAFARLRVRIPLSGLIAGCRPTACRRRSRPGRRPHAGWLRARCRCRTLTRRSSPSRTRPTHVDAGGRRGPGRRHHGAQPRRAQLRCAGLQQSRGLIPPSSCIGPAGVVAVVVQLQEGSRRAAPQPHGAICAAGCCGGGPRTFLPPPLPCSMPRSDRRLRAAPHTYEAISHQSIN